MQSFFHVCNDGRILVMFVMMVVMLCSPVSMYSASISVDCGTISILRIIFSCIWWIFLSSFFVVVIVSPPMLC